MTEAQERKLGDVPRHLRDMYREAVGGNRRAAIRLHCLECVAWLPSEVEACSAPGCVMWPFRMTGTHAGRHAEASARAVEGGAVAHFGAPGIREGSALETPLGPSVASQAVPKPSPGSAADGERDKAAESQECAICDGTGVLHDLREAGDERPCANCGATGVRRIAARRPVQSPVKRSSQERQAGKKEGERS